MVNRGRVIGSKWKKKNMGKKSFTYTLSYGIKNIHLYSCTIVLILRLEFQTF